MIVLATKPAMTAVAVDAVMAAANAHAAQLECCVTVAVVDDTLAPRALLRMDGADVLTVGLAVGKARLAAANGMPTSKWRGLTDDDPYLGLTIPTALDRLLDGAILFGGGYPIRVDGHTIGGIGVSGGSENQDDAIARAALNALPQAEQHAAPSAHD
jgi:uncharacterized protein GlcG (DUF336 family)